MEIIFFILCIVLALIPALLVFRKDRTKNIPFRWLPACIRFFVGFLIAALIFAPQFKKNRIREERPLLIWMQDNSASVARALGNDSASYLNDVKKIKEDWEDEYQVIALPFSADLGSSDNKITFDGKSTNITGALQDVLAQYKDRNLGAIVLASDGVYNEGIDPSLAPLGSAVPIYTVGLGDSTRPRDIRADRVYTNKTVPYNSSFEILVDISAEKLKDIQAPVQLLHKGRTLQQQTVQINQDQYTGSVRFVVKATEKGLQQYTVYLPTQAGEQNTANNKITVLVEVIDMQSQVLIWAAAPHPDIAAIRSAMAGVDQYKIEINYGSSLPRDISKYSILICHGLPARTVSIPELPSMPTWFILSAGSDISGFSRLQEEVQIRGNGSRNEVLPKSNPAFSYFALPTGLPVFAARMPPLIAPYGEYKTTGQSLFYQQIGSIATEFPLWSFHSGEQARVFLMGEGIWRWRLYEFKQTRDHRVVDDLIRQTLNFLTTQKDSRPFRVFMDKYVLADNEPVQIYAELHNRNGEMINGPQAQLRLTDSAGKSLDYIFEKRGNSYFLNVGLLSAGSYKWSGKTSFDGNNYSSEGQFEVSAMRLEDLRTYADFGLLSALAHRTNAVFFPMSQMAALKDSIRLNEGIKTVIHTESSFVSLIDLKWIFWLILLLAAVEWGLRKYWNL